MSPRARPVLLVEDDPSDQMLMREALKGGPGLIELAVVSDGLEALAYLRGQAPHAGAPRPAFVLLDWRLPGKSGAEVLADIRADASLKALPVLVLTTSASEEDVGRAYALGANCFLTKPTGLDNLQTLVRLLEEFWLTHAVLPGPGRR